MSEFDKDRFETPPDPEYICAICHCIFDKPQETPCRHVFCKVCIETWVKSRNNGTSMCNYCPSCREAVSLRDLKPALPLVCNVISKLRVKCIFASNGCPVILAKEHIKKHEKSCVWELVKCRNYGCGKTHLVRDKDRHEAECEMKLVMCQKDCQLSLPRREMKTHKCLDALKKKLKETRQELQTSRALINEILSGQVRSMASVVRHGSSHRSYITADIFARLRGHIQRYARAISHDRESTSQFANTLVASLRPHLEHGEESPTHYSDTPGSSPELRDEENTSYSPGYNPNQEYSPSSPNHASHNNQREYRPTPIPRYSPISPRHIVISNNNNRERWGLIRWDRSWNLHTEDDENEYSDHMVSGEEGDYAESRNSTPRTNGTNQNHDSDEEPGDELWDRNTDEEGYYGGSRNSTPHTNDTAINHDSDSRESELMRTSNSRPHNDDDDDDWGLGSRDRSLSYSSRNDNSDRASPITDENSRQSFVSSNSSHGRRLGNHSSDQEATDGDITDRESLHEGRSANDVSENEIDITEDSFGTETHSRDSSQNNHSRDENESVDNNDHSDNDSYRSYFSDSDRSHKNMDDRSRDSEEDSDYSYRAPKRRESRNNSRRSSESEDNDWYRRSRSSSRQSNVSAVSSTLTEDQNQESDDNERGHREEGNTKRKHSTESYVRKKSSAQKNTKDNRKTQTTSHNHSSRNSSRRSKSSTHRQNYVESGSESGSSNDSNVSRTHSRSQVDRKRSMIKGKDENHTHSFSDKSSDEMSHKSKKIKKSKSRMSNNASPRKRNQGSDNSSDHSDDPVTNNNKPSTSRNSVSTTTKSDHQSLRPGHSKSNAHDERRDRENRELSPVASSSRVSDTNVRSKSPSLTVVVTIDRSKLSPDNRLVKAKHIERKKADQSQPSFSEDEDQLDDAVKYSRPAIKNERRRKDSNEAFHESDGKISEGSFEPDYTEPESDVEINALSNKESDNEIETRDFERDKCLKIKNEKKNENRSQRNKDAKDGEVPSTSGVQRHSFKCKRSRRSHKTRKRKYRSYSSSSSSDEQDSRSVKSYDSRKHKNKKRKF